MVISERIKELRLSNDLKQIELAEKIGYSKSMIAYWENGKRTPTLPALVALADYFEVSTDYLLGRAEY